MSGASEGASLVPDWFATHHRAVVWMVLLAAVVMASVALILGLATHLGEQPLAPQHPVAFVGSALVIAAYAFVFALLVLRLPRNAVGWVFGLFAIVVAISNLTWGYLVYAVETVPPRLPGAEVAVLLGACSGPFWPFLVIALIVLFPNGRPLTPGWGRLVIVAALIAAAAVVAIALSSGPLPIWVESSMFAVPGPIGVIAATIARVLLLILVLLVPVAIRSLSLRYRASNEVGRLQLKWLVYAGGLFAAAGLVFLLAEDFTELTSSSARTATWLLLCLGAIGVPVAASVAVLRYRLYEIDTIIGRTLVYGGLTAILAGVYAAAMRLFNWLFEELTGEHSDIALVLTTLVLATTLTPIKTWLEGRVAARHKAALEPEPGSAVDAGRLDDAAERIARRAATIVIAQLAGSAAGDPGPGSRRAIEAVEPGGEPLRPLSVEREVG